jgi:hypothetical protein
MHKKTEKLKQEKICQNESNVMQMPVQLLYCGWHWREEWPSRQSFVKGHSQSAWCIKEATEVLLQSTLILNVFVTYNSTVYCYSDLQHWMKYTLLTKAQQIYNLYDNSTQCASHADWFLCQQVSGSKYLIRSTEVLPVIFHKRFYQLRAKTEYLCKFNVAAPSIYFFEHKHKQNYFGNSWNRF